MKRRLQIIVLLALWPLLVGAWWPWFQLGNNILDPRGSRSTGFSTTTHVTWVGWDGLSEARLADATTFVCLFENAVAGGNETAQGGGLAGANLVLTQAGNVAGALNVPPRRSMDGGDDAFSFTQAAVDGLLQGQATWSIIIRARMIGPDTDGAYFRVRDAAAINSQVQFYHTLGNLPFRIALDDSNSPQEIQVTGASLAAATTYWFFAGTSGASTRGGFCETGTGVAGQPTRWSDFPATQRVTFANLYESFGAFDGDRFIAEISATGQFLNFRILSIIISTGECLIDFAS